MDAFDVTQLFNVEGLVAVITGGGTGLGLCMRHLTEPFLTSRYLLRFGSEWSNSLYSRTQEGET